ncbi:MarR family winged helix-turn-helix transcriptional regulator [Alteromonas sp. ASW11-130]|uniref:MarR family winged helix-turn-helix transcriptional regulator n=1 Tax=Alteromonas sp. ASW11-130 TaxID=3015775 RepID=UPI0022419D30|nr:MarR family winged helix-turn-helix transcriptional regulator [Alteromonas sp. ASW11-130]MCW8090410.1 MarR family winged helix-turn-helix transcriptional regulator [Alteromonas sp. ASW11-130]
MSSENNDSILKLERFLPYRLSILSNKVSSLVADIYKDKFAISITEWRIMAVLGEYPDISADEISAKTQIEKSILSRSVSKLLKRKLIERDMAEDDKRRSVIRLSTTGKSVYDEIVPLSYEYERALLKCFTKEEQAQFSALIDQLYEHASSLQI